MTLFQTGDLDAGIHQLGRAVEAGQGRDWAEPITVCVNDIDLHLLRHAPLDQLTGLIEHQRRLFGKGSFSGPFSEGMIGALTELLKLHRDIPLERLLQLRDGVVSELGKEEEFVQAVAEWIEQFGEP